MKVALLTAFAHLVALFFLRTSLGAPFEFAKFLAFFGVATGTFLSALWMFGRLKARLTLPLLIATTLLFRVLLATNSPILSTDVHRYLWDGSALLHGVHPLAHRPADPEIEWLQKIVPLPPDHQEIPSVYPLAAQLLFGLGALLRPSPSTFGIFAAILDALTAGLLFLTLRRRGCAVWPVLLFAWHPLSIVESGHSGHIDALGIFFLALSIYFVGRHPLRSSLAIAGAALTKLWPAILLPIGWTEPRRRQSALIGALLFGGLAGAFWLSAGTFEGLQTYARTWEFHGSLFPFLRLFLSGEAARAFLCILFVAFWSFVLFGPGKVRRLSFEDASLWILAAFFLCSPTVHPWYALWLLPFLVIRPNLEGVAFTLAIATAYAVLPDYFSSGVWQEALWPRIVTYGLPALIWAWRASKRKPTAS